MKTVRLCVVTTHPIQYVVPWFRLLAADPQIALHVIYFREPTPDQQGAGFGAAVQWDVPLRDGYESTVLGQQARWTALPKLGWLLRAAIKRCRPDVVLITGWNEPGLIAVYPIVRTLGLPIIVRGESNALRKRGRVTRWFHRTLLGWVSAAVTIGRSNHDFYLAAGLSPDRLFRSGYFVNSDHMLGMSAEHRHQRDDLRSSAGYSEDQFVFCFVGKHIPSKRPMLLVEGAALLQQRGYKIALHMAGSGELTMSLKDRAKELDVPAHFTGFLNQSELWKAYVPADALVLPSTNAETWGLVVNEAMLFGLPVIVSAQVGCGPDLVIEGETGFVFDGDAMSLSLAMERMLRARSRTVSMGERARELVRQQFSGAMAAEGLKSALGSVLGLAASEPRRQ